MTEQYCVVRIGECNEESGTDFPGGSRADAEKWVADNAEDYPESRFVIEPKMVYNPRLDPESDEYYENYFDDDDEEDDEYG